METVDLKHHEFEGLPQEETVRYRFISSIFPPQSILHIGITCASQEGRLTYENINLKLEAGIYFGSKPEMKTLSTHKIRRSE
jgi:hypothetical protein